MKLKHLPKILPFICSFLLTVPMRAQQTIGNVPSDQTTATYTMYDNGKLGPSNPTTQYPENSMLNLPGCDTLFGSPIPNNGNTGIMFRVRATQMTRVEFINCHLTTGAGYVRLYGRFGTWVGHETDLSGWSLIDSVYMNVTIDSIYRIPIYVGQVLHVNESASYYITFNPSVAGIGGVGYTNGLADDTLYSNNATLQMYEGVGHGPLFTACCSPRVFSGSIEHCPVTINDCQSMTTTFAGGNSNDGAMFDITTNHDIMVKGFSSLLNNSGTFALYYRYGTFLGHQDSASHWTFVDTNTVTSAGLGIPTQLFSNLNIPLNEGESMAFYVTSTNAGASEVAYTNGTAVGNLFSYDGVVRFYEGHGKGYPFAANYVPRVFTGKIDYCITQGFIGIDENGEMSNKIDVYPVPTSSELFMDFNEVEGDREIIITDMTGRVCAKLNNQTANLVRINVEEFTNGVYLYNIINRGRKEASGKFIKQ